MKVDKMKRVAKNSNRIVPLGLSLAMIVGLSACASTNVVKMTEAAPITYKLGQGGAKYASLSLPKSSRPSLPSTRPQARPQRLAEPEPYALPTAPIPHSPSVTVPSGPQFNPGDVDTRLYAHQKVGQRYTIKGKSYTPKHDPSYDNVGIASWYGKKFHGRKTATGEIYNMNDMTAAHKTLPLNSMVHVENLENGRTLIVRVNDRGPFAEGRIIDLSKASASPRYSKTWSKLRAMQSQLHHSKLCLPCHKNILMYRARQIQMPRVLIRLLLEHPCRRLWPM